MHEYCGVSHGQHPGSCQRWEKAGEPLGPPSAWGGVQHQTMARGCFDTCWRELPPVTIPLFKQTTTLGHRIWATKVLH